MHMKTYLYLYVFMLVCLHMYRCVCLYAYTYIYVCCPVFFVCLAVYALSSRATNDQETFPVCVSVLGH